MRDIIFNDGKTIITGDGGIGVKLINKTGAVSVKGTLVDSSSTLDNAFSIETTNAFDAFGVVYEDGVADGEECFIVVAGAALVLLEDGTTATRGYWTRASGTQAGRADATNQNPPGGTIAEIDNHFKEIGHCLESKIAGTDVLCRFALHFN